MSSPQSRQRQRHRRRAREKLWAAQRNLAERQVDLVSYERVLADMARCELPPFAGSQAIALVSACRNETLRDCEVLGKTVASLEVP